MVGSLKFIQIYYKEEQLPLIYDFADPYKNTSLTPYFENKVIAELVPTINEDYISICSWRLRQKRGDSSTPIVLKNNLSLTKEKILGQEYDIACLTPRSPSHKMLYMASHWHGHTWDTAIKKLYEFIKVPEEITKAIYENHFIARREVYHSYVRDCLIPCINFMERFPEIFLASADYLKRKKSPAEKEHARLELAKLGLNDYPIAPFMLERLFSIWIEGNGFKIVNI